MSRQIKYSILGLMLLLGCNNHRSCIGIINGKFSGYALSFYHRPVSGGNFEMLIFPVCDADSIMLSQNLKANINSISLLNGLSYPVNVNNNSFREVFKKSKKLKLTNNQTLASEFSEIYVCPVFIELNNIKNDTESITGSGKKSLQKKLVFENGGEFILTYIFSNSTKVYDVRAL